MAETTRMSGLTEGGSFLCEELLLMLVGLMEGSRTEEGWRPEDATVEEIEWGKTDRGVVAVAVIVC